MDKEYNPNERNLQDFDSTGENIAEYEGKFDNSEFLSVSSAANESSDYSVGEEFDPQKYGSIESPNAPDEDDVEEEKEWKYSPEVNEEETKKFPLWLKIVIPMLGVIVVSLLVLLATGVFSSKKSVDTWQTTVPNVLKTDYSSANSKLAEADLIALIGDKKSSAGIEEGTVMSQGIEAEDVVGKGNIVRLTLSAGKEEIVVPDVSYYTADYAKQVLTAKGMNVSIQDADDDSSDSVAPGAVVSSDPSPNAAVTNTSKIILYVKGDTTNDVDSPNKVTVPNLSGMDFSTIAESLAQKKIYLAIDGTTPGAADQAGKIVSQSSVADSEVPEGTVINVVVCSGAEGNTVPDVTYRKLETAINMISESGLKADIQYEESTKVLKGTVISQSIEEGTTANKDDIITIVVSSGKIVHTPNLKGTTMDAAVNTLVDSMLAVNVVYRVDKGAKLGTVLDQNYTAGTDVQIGTVVTITVCGKKNTGEMLKTTNVNDETTVPDDEETTAADETTTEESTTTAQGYSFTIIKDAGIDSIEISYTDKNVTQKAKITSDMKTFTIPEGSKVTVKANTKAGYIWSNWKTDSATLQSPTHSFNMPAKTVTFIASSKQDASSTTVPTTTAPTTTAAPAPPETTTTTTAATTTTTSATPSEQ